MIDMRLIDADELLKLIPPEETCSRFAVENATTIESERKKGKWIVSHVPGSMLWECNQCGFDCGAHSFNFCPMCGVKMERSE